MCTVTVVAAVDVSSPDRGPLVRLVCNRDEQRSRPPSRDLSQVRVGRRGAVMPIDPASGGTWIGANDAGMVACLLNATPPEWSGGQVGFGRETRGVIVPELLSAASIEEAADVAGRIDAARFAPFRLILLDIRRFFLAWSDGRSTAHAMPAQLKAPLMLTSSGLGDHVVESPRREVFERVFSGKFDPLAAQADFHEHRRDAESHLSVLMSRPDARTVSRTRVDVNATATVLWHNRLNDELGLESPASRAELPHRPAEVAA